MSFAVEGVNKRFGPLWVLKDFRCSLPESAVTVMLGPSGCGKTTFLKILSGLIQPDAGDLGGIDGLRPALVFQEPRLLPWRTVRQNLELVTSPDDSGAGGRIEALLNLVGLGRFGNYRPGALSGGMRQRVSLVRGFCIQAEILLMDEPFQGLDLRLKRELVDSFAKLWTEDPKTALLVTHSVDEALLLGDRILVLSERPMSVIQELDNPVPSGERVLGSAMLAETEASLYRLLLG
jgi:NitT/TauT family transport system ATP-binding protein